MIIDLIGATTTRAGLSVHAERDTAAYPNGVKIPDPIKKSRDTTGVLGRHDFDGEWNYTLAPPNRHNRVLITGGPLGLFI